MNLTPQQKKKLAKLDKLEKAIKGNVVSVFEHIDDVEEELQSSISEVKDIVDNLDIPERLTTEELQQVIEPLIPKPVKGDKGDRGDSIKGDKGDNGKDGRDGKDGANGINGIDGLDGKDADPQEIINQVELDLEVRLPQFGTQFRDGLELLQDEERLDKKAIKGLDDYEDVARLARLPRGGGGKQNLYQLNDVNIQLPTNNQVLKYNSTTNLWENGVGGGSFVWSSPPINPTDTATAGDIAYDSDYFYVAVATDTWKRTALSTWSVANSFMLLEDGSFLLLESGDKIIL